MIKQQIKIFLIFLIFSTLINVIILNLFYRPKKVATIDVQSIKNEYVQNIANREYSAKDIDKFITKINFTIDKIAKDNNLIIVPKQAVFSGEDIDITDQFRRIVLDVE